MLGEVLDVSIPVRLDGGEDLRDNCLTADVWFGENKQATGTVQVRVEGAGVADRGQRTVRITSSRRVDEPFVTLYIAAGCESTISRKFVLFADPPAVVPAVAGATASDRPDGARAGTTPTNAGMAGGSIAGSSIPSARGEHAPRRADAAAHARTVADEPAGSDRPAAAASRPGRDAPRSRPAAASAVAAAPAVDPSLRVSPAPVRTAAGAEAAGRPRLMLDPAEADVLITPELRMAAGFQNVPAADGPVPADLRARRAAAAAMWKALNATPEELARDRLRLQELEARLAALRQPAAASGAEGGAAGSGAVAHSPLVFALAGLSAALAAALAAVLWRVRRRAGQGDWWRDEPQAAAAPTGSAAAEPAPPAAAASAPVSGLPSMAAAVGADAPRAAGVPQAAAPVTPAHSPRAVFPSSRSPAGAGPSPAPAVPAAAAARAASAAAPAGATAELSLRGNLFGKASGEPPRAVSVEELIDLEQQAEFFLVLGQDQAAIDLLESHIAGAAGGSPLPYLKLLELYQRRGDREAYERVRERFNGRFNAYAPSWDADLQAGHSLIDYPGVIERLQSLWTTPEQAMEVLQASLLRSDPQADTFDLPAYRELLFLYSVARDLAERETRQPAVDLLLPFGEDAPVVVEPLTATRPVKAQPSAQPPLVVDFTLDDIPEPPSDPVPPVTPIHPPQDAGPQTGPIEFEHIEVPKKG